MSERVLLPSEEKQLGLPNPQFADREMIRIPVVAVEAVMVGATPPPDLVYGYRTFHRRKVARYGREYWAWVEVT